MYSKFNFEPDVISLNCHSNAKEKSKPNQIIYKSQYSPFLHQKFDILPKNIKFQANYYSSKILIEKPKQRINKFVVFCFKIDRKNI